MKEKRKREREREGWRSTCRRSAPIVASKSDPNDRALYSLACNSMPATWILYRRSSSPRLLSFHATSLFPLRASSIKNSAKYPARSKGPRKSWSATPIHSYGTANTQVATMHSAAPGLLRMESETRTVHEGARVAGAVLSADCSGIIAAVDQGRDSFNLLIPQLIQRRDASNEPQQLRLSWRLSHKTNICVFDASPPLLPLPSRTYPALGAHVRIHLVAVEDARYLR